MKPTASPPPDLWAGSALVEELPARLEPWRAFQLLAALPRVAFLDSAMAHADLGRYSYITGDPFEWIMVGPPFASGPRADPLVLLKDTLARYVMPTLPGLPPFQGGAVGVFGYDLCHYLEKLPRPAINDFLTPDLAVGLYDWVAAFDHFEKRSWIISTGLPAANPRQRRQWAARRMRQVWRLLQGYGEPDPFNLGRFPIGGAVVSNLDRETYLATVSRAIDYIHAGDCFQVNIAQRLMCEARGSPLHLYEKLRLCNPAPFAAYLDLGEFVIASASPERFLRIQDGEVETRPIKGTRPRGPTPELDSALQSELLASSKDRAENVMIVDLLRNDLGRVCEYGSIKVHELCRLETYQYVHHLVSQVRGLLRTDKGPIDLLRAAFPGGSVTGAPKIRAMEIIAELEPTARGPYCGSLGCIGFDGFMDTNILIRTFTIGHGLVQFPVGGGIVADSIPEREYEESLHKAEGMLRALL
jgi:para-aminobenzoate synthetase component I